MTLPLAGALGPSAYWYLTRSTGVVALVLLTLSVALGVADVARMSSRGWPRFLVDSTHRTVSLLAVVFLLVHIITSVLDGFAPISLLDAVVPFAGRYRPLWLGFGALACDLLLAVAITSLMRQRLGHRAWRATHWMAYACWPVALLHALGTGSDVKGGWMLVICAACTGVVLVAVAVRVVDGWPEQARLRGAAVAASLAFSVGLLVWLPSGPLGSNWARRSGTPGSLLPHATRAAAAAGVVAAANAGAVR